MLNTSINDHPEKINSEKFGFSQLNLVETQLSLFSQPHNHYYEFKNFLETENKRIQKVCEKVENIKQSNEDDAFYFPSSSPLSGDDAKKQNEVYKNKRILREKQKQKRDFSRMAQHMGRLYYEQTDKKESYVSFYRQFKKEFREQIENEIEETKKALNQAKKEMAGDTFLYDLSELMKEKTKLYKRLAKYESNKVLTIGKKQVPASLFSHKKAKSLRMCSTFLIRKETEDKKEQKYRQRCGDRNCPVCGHFRSQKLGRAIKEAFKDRLLITPKEELKRGRLVHMVLTVKNVGLDQIGNVKKAWRIIQKKKDLIYTKKKNPYGVWEHAKWGFWKFEVTYNEEMKNYHPHLHLLVWVDGWLASTSGSIKRVLYADVSELRKVKVNEATRNYIQRRRKNRKSKGIGWWTEMQKSWRTACKEVGLTAYVNGSKAVKGAKMQHVGGVLWFSADKLDDQMKNINDMLDGATAEISKYVSKSNDLMNIENDEELLRFMASMHGKQVISGFGGMSIAESGELTDEEFLKTFVAFDLQINENFTNKKIAENYVLFEMMGRLKDLTTLENELSQEKNSDVSGIPAYEVVYRYNLRLKRFVEVARYVWNEKAFQQFREDMKDYRMRNEILDGYENSYRRTLDGGDPVAEKADEQILAKVS